MRRARSKDSRASAPTIPICRYCSLGLSQRRFERYCAYSALSFTFSRADQCIIYIYIGHFALSLSFSHSLCVYITRYPARTRRPNLAVVQNDNIDNDLTSPLHVKEQKVAGRQLTVKCGCRVTVERLACPRAISYAKGWT